MVSESFNHSILSRLRLYSYEKYPIHGSEIPLDVLQPDPCLQDVALVRSHVGQKLFDLKRLFVDYKLSLISEKNLCKGLLGLLNNIAGVNVFNDANLWQKLVTDFTFIAMLCIFINQPYLPREVDNVPVNQHSAASRVSRVQTADTRSPPCCGNEDEPVAKVATILKFRG